MIPVIRPSEKLAAEAVGAHLLPAGPVPGQRVVPQPLRAARRAGAMLFFLNGALFANWVSRIPAVQMERGLSHGMLGAALLSVGLGALLAMPSAGRAAVRLGSDRISRWAALGYCAALPAVAAAPNAVTFVVALFCFGAMHGALDVAMNAQAVEIERRYAYPIMSSFHALFSLGGLVGATLGGLVAARGVSPCLHFSLVAVLLAGLALLVIFPHLLSTAEAPGRMLDEPAGRMPAMPGRVLAVLGVIAFCVMMGEGAMADWSGIYLRREVGAGEGLAAAGYAAFSVAMSLGRFSGDRLFLAFGPVKLLRSGGLIAAGGLTLALLTKEPLVSLIGFAAVGAGFATVVPQVFSAAGREDRRAAGSAVAAVTTIGYLGFLIGPPFIGEIAELFGLPRALAVIVLTSLLFVILARGVGHNGNTRFRAIVRPSRSAKAVTCSTPAEIT